MVKWKDGMEGDRVKWGDSVGGREGRGWEEGRM